MLPLVEPTPRNICAVIVTFHPDDGFEERLEVVAPQVARVVVVDNASSAEARGRLDRLAATGRIDLVALPENEGIAAALNRGLRRAIEGGFAWAITFDQDSIAEPNLVERLLAIRHEYPRRDVLAILGANYRETTAQVTGTPRNARHGGPWIEVDEVITSGCLQSLQVFDEIGPYREDFFMYFVDNEYCKRARTAGYRVILAREPLLRHQTGHATLHRFLSREVLTWNYAPWRHYYIVRNGLVTARLYAAHDPRWAVNRWYSVVKRSVAALVFEEDKAAKLRYMLRGAYDGVRGHTGRLEM
jgi:rhamnosyltransferase